MAIGPVIVSFLQGYISGEATHALLEGPIPMSIQAVGLETKHMHLEGRIREGWGRFD